MITTEWTINETIKVRVDPDEGYILIMQGKGTAADWVRVGKFEDAEGLIQALIEATEAIEWDSPDLSRQGYERNEGRD